MRATPGLFLALATLLALPVRADLRHELETLDSRCAAELQRAAWLGADGRPTEALAAVREAARADPACPRARLEEARLLRGLGDLPAAAAALRPLATATLAAEPGARSLAGLEAMRLYARVSLELGEPRRSLYWNSRLLLLADAPRLGAELAGVYVDMARARERRNELGSMLALAEAAADAAPRRGDSPWEHPFRKNYAFQGVVHWLEDGEEEDPPPPANPPPSPARARPPPAAWAPGASIPTNRVFTCLARDWTTARLAAFWGDEPRMTELDPGQGRVREVPLELPAAAAGAAPTGDGWLCWTAKNSSLRHLDPDGRLRREYPAPAQVDTAVACPRLQRAWVHAGGVQRALDLRDGQWVDCANPGTGLLAVDPLRQRLYQAFDSTRVADITAPPQLRQLLGAAVAFGRPEHQAALVQYAYGEGASPVCHTLRTHAAGRSFTLDAPAGADAAVLAGGEAWTPSGWRPGVRILSAAGLEPSPVLHTPPGDEPTLGAALDPASGDLAVWSAGGLALFPRGATSPVFTTRARLGRAGVWSADGSLLAIGGETGAGPGTGFRGLTLLAVERTPGERAAAENTLRTLRGLPQPPADATTAGGPEPAPEREALASFSPSADPEPARARLLRVLSLGPSPRLPEWARTGLYRAPTQSGAYRETRDLLDLPAGRHATLLALKAGQIAKSRGEYAPAIYAEAWFFRAAGDSAAAGDAFLRVIRLDRGRTDLTSLALAWLGESLTGRKQFAAAMDCLAAGLELDRSHGLTLDLTRPLAPAPPGAGPDPLRFGPLPPESRPPPVFLFPHRALASPRLPESEVAAFAARGLLRLHTAAGDRVATLITAGGLALTTASAVTPIGQPLSASIHRVDGKTSSLWARIPVQVAWVDEGRDLALVRLPFAPPGVPHVSFSPVAARDRAKLLLVDAPVESGDWRPSWRDIELESEPFELNGRHIQFLDIPKADRIEGAPLLNRNGQIAALPTGAGDQAEGYSAITAPDIARILGAAGDFPGP